MGREVRRVPLDWQHPDGCSLFDGYNAAVAEWDEGKIQWDKGFVQDYSTFPVVSWKPLDGVDTECRSFEEWHGERPKQEDYMPDWSAEERTHYQMYETTSEGSPISPVKASPEELARWLADNNASAFAGMTCTYEQWLNMIVGSGSSVSAVMSNGVMTSGVAAMDKNDG